MIMRPAYLATMAIALLAQGCAVVPSPASEPLGGGASPRGEIRVVVVSDLNGPYGSTTYEPRVAEAVRLIREEWRPDLVLSAGDHIAGQRPQLTDSLVRAMWAAFDTVVGAPLREAGIPFAPTIGNHDGSRYPGHARDRRLAIEHWSDPARDPRLPFVDGTGFPLNYTLRVGDLFVLVWDASNEETARDPDLLAWVERSLTAEPARTASLRLVLGHLPLYAVAEGRNSRGEVLAEADSLRSLLAGLGVHTYVSGHHHAYYPGRSGELELLHTGALGQSPRPLIGSDADPFHALTVLDLWPSTGAVVYTTYRLDGDGTAPIRVETSTLPLEVRGFNGTVRRRDTPG